MKPLITNNRFMGALGAVVAIVGFAVGLYEHDFTAFARSGALLVGLGIVVLARTFIAGTELYHTIFDENDLNIYSRESHVKRGDPIPEWVYEQERNLFALGKLGPGLSFAGTVIWGFGDLLNKL